MPSHRCAASSSGSGPSRGNGRTSASQPGSKKNGNDRRSLPAEAAHPVRGRAVAAAGHAVEHVADVAHERPGLGRHVDPPVSAAHLQPAVVVLGKDREQAVVGVLGHAPAIRVGLGGRVAEDAEQDRRVGGEVADEPVGCQAEAEGDRLASAVAARSAIAAIHTSTHAAQLGRLGGEQVRPVQQGPGHDPRIVGRQLGPK